MNFRNSFFKSLFCGLCLLTGLIADGAVVKLPVPEKIYAVPGVEIDLYSIILLQ